MENRIYRYMETLKNEEKILIGAILENLRELKEKVTLLNLRIWTLEKIINERIPERVLSEKFFKTQIEDGNDVVKEIVEEVKKIIKPVIASEKIGIVESKKIQEIISIMRENGRVSASQLSKILNLSRTRCNEYLKKMENLGIARGMKIGKIKYYQLLI